LCGPSSNWAQQAYAAQGVETAPDAGVPPDYIGTELEFMYFLARHELAARATGDAVALDAVTQSQTEFVVLHLAHWLPAFIARIRAAEPGPVFGAIVDLLENVLRDDIQRLSSN
jgi:TorA maturation chaperone TorD